MAALEAFETRGYHEVGLEQIGKAAGLSRQSVYVHFGSKAQLVTDLVAWVEERERLGDLLSGVFEATTGREALLRLIDVHAVFEKKIERMAIVIDHGRGTAPELQDLYADRMGRRYQGMRAILAWVKSDGDLASGWTIDTATALVWTLTAPPTFRLLTTEQGWTPKKWATQTKKVISSTLLQADPNAG